MRAALFALGALLLGTTGCDPCADLDAELVAAAPRAEVPSVPLPGAPTDASPEIARRPAEPQIILTISGIGLAARAGDVFVPGRGEIAGTEVAWQTLGVRFRDSGSEATVGVLVRRPEALVGGTLTIPVHLRTTPRRGGGAVLLVPSGPSSLTLADGSDGASIAAGLDPLVPTWFKRPILGFDGWYLPSGELAVHVGPAQVDGPVITWEIGTALPAAPVDASERARRPGMSDDFTMAISTELVAMLSQRGWTPVVRSGEPPAAPPPPDDFSLLTLRPTKSERGFVVPALARAQGQCRYAEVRTEARPATESGGLAWKPPSDISMPRSHKVDAETRDALSAASLQVFAAPLAKLPLTGPARHPAEARIARTHGDTLLLDGVLGAVKGRRLPKEPPPPLVPSANR